MKKKYMCVCPYTSVLEKNMQLQACRLNLKTINSKFKGLESYMREVHTQYCSSFHSCVLSLGNCNSTWNKQQCGLFPHGFLTSDITWPGSQVVAAAILIQVVSEGIPREGGALDKPSAMHHVGEHDSVKLCRRL